MIHVNGIQTWAGVCQEKTNISFDFEPLDTNTLFVTHHGKSFGENRVWNTTATSDRNIIIQEIKIDHVNIHNLLYLGVTSNLFNEQQTANFHRDGQEIPFIKNYVHHEKLFMGYNGTYVINFPKEVYDWIIIENTKFSRPSDPTRQSSLNSVNWRLDWINSGEIYHLLDEIEGYISKI